MAEISNNGRTAVRERHAHVQQQPALRLDQVVTSQPELGPAAPDGGYGWFVLLSCVYIQLTIPSVLSSYGSFLLFDQIENLDHDNEYLLWDHEITWVPIIFMAFWTLADPWCETVVSTSKWPRLTTICGVCLVCGGNMITWAAELHEPSIIVFYMIAGAITGIGASLTTMQCEFLMKQYFRRKYKIAKNALYLGHILGFVITPFLIGKLIVRHGALESMLVYQLILAQGIIVALTFKQPKFILPETTAYTLLESSSGDDEEHLVFDKTTEGIQPSTFLGQDTIPEETFNYSTYRSFKAPVEVHARMETINEYPESAGSVNRARTSSNNSDLNRIDIIPEPPKKKLRSHAIQARMESSFAEEFANDLDRLPRLGDEPQPLPHTENASFSYDNLQVYNTITQTIHVPGRVYSMSFRESAVLLGTPAFYKSLLLVIIAKLSMLVFWVLYPSVLYNEINFLNVHHTITSVTFVAIGGLFFTIFWNCFIIPREKVKFFLALSLYMASGGFFVISTAQTKNWLVCGGLATTAALSSLHVLTDTILLQNCDAIKQSAHMMLNTLAGIVILLTVVLDIEYKECFISLAVLQFAVGSIWLTNILYKKIKKLLE